MIFMSKMKNKERRQRLRLAAAGRVSPSLSVNLLPLRRDTRPAPYDTLLAAASPRLL